MALYTNHSRLCAIVTVNLQSTENPGKALQKGLNSVFEDLNLEVGYHDIIVEPAHSLVLGPNTVATIVGVRG